MIHDAADAERRFGYVARRIERVGARVGLIAVSDSVCRALLDHGVGPDVVRVVRNGLDVWEFEERLERARIGDVFNRVCERNNVPSGGRVVLVSARRVPWKGHGDVVAAAVLLGARGVLADVRFVFNGAGMLDTRWPGYEVDLVCQIRDLGLSGGVFLLDASTRRRSPPVMWGPMWSLAPLVSRSPSVIPTSRRCSREYPSWPPGMVGRWSTSRMVCRGCWCRRGTPG